MATSKDDDGIEVVKETNTWYGYFNMVFMDALFRIANLLLYRRDGTVNRWLESRIMPYLHWPASYHAGKNTITTEDISIDTEHKVSFRIYKTKASDSADEKLPVVMFIHGGGFVSFSAFDTTFNPYCKKIAMWCNAVVISVEYRKAPESHFPTAYDDCQKAIEWLKSPEARSHLPPAADISQFFLMGDSAGANLVHYLGCNAIKDGISPLQLRGMVLLQPFFGGEKLTKAEEKRHYVLTLGFCQFGWKAYLPKENRDNPYCNVFGPNAFDISGLELPPIFVAIGSEDCLRDRQRAYVKKLKEMGKDVTAKYFEGVAHAFYVTGTANQSDVCVRHVHDFIRLHAL